MAGLALSVAVLGGIVSLIAGVTGRDWVAAGIGIALIGIGLLLWELIVTCVEGRTPAEPSAPEGR